MEKILETVKYSFVLPAYKAKYIKEAIDSILAQTYTGFELIIVNDASPEDIDSIIEGYDDKRIRYYRNEKNIGGKSLVAQWNQSITHAKGEYLILASDDDVYSDQYLEKMDALVSKYPDVNVFRPRVKRINHKGKIIYIDGYQEEYLTKLEYLYAWTRHWLASGIPFFIFKREALMKIGGFADYPMAWFSDDATVLRLADNGIVVLGTETLFSFRYSNENISTALNTKRTLSAKLKAIKMYYDEHVEFMKDYLPSDTEEEHLLHYVKKNFPKLIRNNKVKSQMKISTLGAILGCWKDAVSIDCISNAFVLKCCKYPFKYAFLKLFGRA